MAYDYVCFCERNVMRREKVERGRRWYEGRREKRLVQEVK